MTIEEKVDALNENLSEEEKKSGTRYSKKDWETIIKNIPGQGRPRNFTYDEKTGKMTALLRAR